MAWLEPGYDPYADKPEEKSIEDLLMMMFGGAADQQHEQWLRLKRQQDERQAALPPAPATVPPSAKSPQNPGRQALDALRLSATQKQIESGGPQVQPLRAPGMGSGYTEDYVPQAAPESEAMTADRRAEMWQKFQEMNPNLNYNAVAIQSGARDDWVTPDTREHTGGTLSEMPGSEAQRRQEQSLYDYVENDIPQQEAMRMLDSRSRAYDPAAAQVLLDRATGKETAAAEEIKARAWELEGQNKLAETKNKLKLTNDPDMQRRMVLAAIADRHKNDPIAGKRILDLVGAYEMAVDAGDEVAAAEIYNELYELQRTRPQQGGGEQKPDVHL